MRILLKDVPDKNKEVRIYKYSDNSGKYILISVKDLLLIYDVRYAFFDDGIYRRYLHVSLDYFKVITYYKSQNKESLTRENLFDVL